MQCSGDIWTNLQKPISVLIISYNTATHSYNQHHPTRGKITIKQQQYSYTHSHSSYFVQIRVLRIRAIYQSICPPLQHIADKCGRSKLIFIKTVLLVVWIVLVLVVMMRMNVITLKLCS